MSGDALQARLAWLRARRAGRPPPPRTPLPQCPELGPPLRDQPKCGCAEKLRECALHGTCTTGAKRDGVACCATCPDHPARGG